jgi:hypothetical protein
MADQISLFGIVVGAALLLSGIGFGVLAVGDALRNPETALGFLRPRTQRAIRIAVDTRPFRMLDSTAKLVKIGGVQNEYRCKLPDLVFVLRRSSLRSWPDGRGLSIATLR